MLRMGRFSSEGLRSAAFGLVCVLFGLVLATAASADVINGDQVSSKVLDNGLRVVCKEGHSAPIVVIDVYVRFGSVDETPETSGVAHALEHMVFQGQDDARVGRLPRMIEGLGGRVTAETSRDHTHFGVAVSSEHFEQAATQLAIAVADPEMEPATIERELSIIDRELTQYAEEPIYTLRDRIYGAVFGDSGYGLPVGGDQANLKNLDRGLLRKTHDAYYTGPNMAVVVVGDVAADEVFRVVESAFGGFRDAQPPARRDVEERRRTDGLVLDPIQMPVGRTIMMIGFPAPGLAKDPKAVCALDVLMSILDNSGHCRYIDHIVKEKQLASAMSAMYLTQRDPGIFYTWAAVPEDGVEAAANAVREELADIRANGVPDDEIERAKRILTASFAVQSETYVDQAGTLGFYESIDSYKFGVDYEHLIMAVTADDVRRLAHDYLDPEAYVLASAVPLEGGGAEQP
jgi:zinc protease